MSEKHVVMKGSVPSTMLGRPSLRLPKAQGGSHVMGITEKVPREGIRDQTPHIHLPQAHFSFMLEHTCAAKEIESICTDFSNPPPATCCFLGLFNYP